MYSHYLVQESLPLCALFTGVNLCVYEELGVKGESLLQTATALLEKHVAPYHGISYPYDVCQ
jgi:hypothetical protein